MAIKPVWGPAPEQVANAKLNQIVEYSEALAGVGTLFRASDPQPAGLFYSYLDGRIRKADGTVIEVDAGQVALTAEATNYIEVDDEGSVSRNTLAFTDFRRPIAIVETDEGSVTTRTDARVNFDFGAGGGADINLAWEGPWETATDYAEGDIVQNGERVSSYRCTSSHTSGTMTEPGIGANWSDVWEVIAQAGGQGAQGNPGTPGASLNWRFDWVNATAYAVNDGVTDGTIKSSYRCHTAHTSSGATRPGLGASWTSYWHYVAQAGSTGAPGAPGVPGINGMVWQGAWDSVTTYAENDGVRADGSTYICTAANTNQEPPNALYWDLVAPKGDQGDPGEPGGSMNWYEIWESGWGYVENDAVPHGDPVSSYRCKADHTASSTNEPGTGVDWQDCWIKFAGAGSDDANTLQGEDGAHYLDRANHTGSQAIATVSGLQSALDGKAASSHTHDDRYYTESEIDAALAGKANSSHTHSISDVTGLSAALDDLDDASLPPVGTEGQVLTVDGGVATWADSTGGTGGGHEIQSNGTPLPQRDALNVTGAGATVTDVGGVTVLNIPGGIGSGVAAQMAVKIDADKAIANSTFLPIEFDSIMQDVGDGFAWDIGDPTKIYATDTFDVFAVGTVEFQSNGTGARAVNLSLSGSAMVSQRQNAVTTDETNLTVSDVFSMTPGDYVQLSARQLSGGALNIRDITRLHLVRLAPQAGVDAAKIQGIDVDETTPTDGQVLAYDAGEDKYVPVDQSGGGDVSLTENQFKTLKFNAAPAVMEFGIEIGAGTDPAILSGGMNAAAIKAAIEASDDFTGFTVDVYGSTTTSTGVDGVALHSGKFILAVQGVEPFPAWGVVQNSEVQTFIVENGDDEDYTLNGLSFQLGITAAELQTDQRAAGGDYNDVTIKGESNPTISGTTLLVGGTASASHTATSGFIASNAFDEDPETTWFTSIVEPPRWLRYDRGSESEELPIASYGIFAHENWVPTEWTLRTSADAVSWTNIDARTGQTLTPSSDNVFDATGTVQRYVELVFVENSTSGQGTQIAGFTVSSDIVHPAALFNSYFPFLVGDVTNPSATGTDAVVSTLYQGLSTSTLVTVADATIEELLISGLILPESTAPVGAYTPANSGHWGTPPTTTAQALDMLAAAFNSWVGPV